MKEPNVPRRPKASSEKAVYSVTFFFPPLPEDHPQQRLFLFSSLAAIYDLFDAGQVGCSLGTLYNMKVPDGFVYQNKRCVIRREKVLSKAHTCR
jgi:hypothetical protein